MGVVSIGLRTIGIKSPKIGNLSGSSYWATLISATIENAAPTKVVMTFSKADTSLLATDFSIAGKTITSLDRDVTNKILTLTVSVTFDYGDTIVVTFNETGETASVTNNISYPLILNDGNTVALYNSQLLSTITKDGSNYVSRWNDSLGSGHDLLQATGTNQPLYSANGITFDGIDNVMKCASFTYVQPHMIYIVLREITNNVGDYVFDGNSGSLGAMNISNGSYTIANYTALGQSVTLTTGTKGIIRGLFNTTASSLQANNTTKKTGTTGSQNMNGFTLGGYGNLVNYCSNILVTDVILRKVADNESTQQAIYNYLASKNNLPTI